MSNVIELRVHCKSCCRELDATRVDSYISVEPCKHCAKPAVVRIVDDPPIPKADVRRYNPGLRRRMRQNKEGKYVKLSDFKELHEAYERLSLDFETVCASPMARFERCGLCGVMTTANCICDHCDGDDSIIKENES